MNDPLLYQLEQLLSAHLPCFNSWQQANVALFTSGVIRAESCQQGAIARAVSCAEQVESTARVARQRRGEGFEHIHVALVGIGSTGAACLAEGCKMTVQVAVYDSVKCQPPRQITVAEVTAALREPDHVVWVDISVVDAEAEALMREVFHFHPLAIEDTRNQRQRPKVEEYVGYLFTILNSVSFNGEDIEFTELDVFAGENFIVTVHMNAEPCIDEARGRVNDVCVLKPVTTGYLLYILLDVVVDSYFPLLDRIGDEIEDIGDAIFEAPRQQSVERLFRLKRTLNEMWRVANQQRDMFMLLMRENNMLVRDESLRFYMRDVYDHLLRISDHITTFRETLTNVVDMYMSAVSNRLNQQVNRLTIITIGTGILAVITGFYGMNFEKTWPPFSAPWGVPFVLSLILLTLLIILSIVYLRRQR